MEYRYRSRLFRCDVSLMQTTQGGNDDCGSQDPPCLPLLIHRAEIAPPGPCLDVCHMCHVAGVADRPVGPLLRTHCAPGRRRRFPGPQGSFWAAPLGPPPAPSSIHPRKALLRGPGAAASAPVEGAEGPFERRAPRWQDKRRQARTAREGGRRFGGVGMGMGMGMGMGVGLRCGGALPRLASPRLASPPALRRSSRGPALEVARGDRVAGDGLPPLRQGRMAERSRCFARTRGGLAMDAASWSACFLGRPRRTLGAK
eukprot:scaffold638_cov382-Prasinococcus_capsulatus_cf.AAC.17